MESKLPIVKGWPMSMLPPWDSVQRDQYVLNQCARSLARDTTESRHDFGHLHGRDFEGSLAPRVAEAWRFPVIDSYFPLASGVGGGASNLVTFVYVSPDGIHPTRVEVIGTFATLNRPIPLQRIPGTPYFSLSLLIPVGQVHTYKYLVDGVLCLDPINPQRLNATNGRVWSRFFTQYCSQPISFERWEWVILERLTDHILPFRTKDGENFLRRHYDYQDRKLKDTNFAKVYRLDHSVGVVNFIDKLLAREELHRLVDYRICLELIDRVLRQRRPLVEPREMPKEVYADLYKEMALGGKWSSIRLGLWAVRESKVLSFSIATPHSNRSLLAS